MLGGTRAYELQISAVEESVVSEHYCHTATKFAASIKEDQERLSTLYFVTKTSQKTI